MPKAKLRVEALCSSNSAVKGDFTCAIPYV